MMRSKVFPVPMICAAAGLLLVVSSPQSAAALDNSAEQSCFLTKHAPFKVARFTVDPGVDWGSYSSTSGAQLFVRASEGLTKELLTARVQQMVDAAKPTPDGIKAVEGNCKFPRLDVHVSVVSAAHGYWVQLTGHDPKTYELISKWAHSLGRRGK